jgi:hypothetical protein
MFIRSKSFGEDHVRGGKERTYAYICADKEK